MWLRRLQKRRWLRMRRLQINHTKDPSAWLGGSLWYLVLYCHLFHPGTDIPDKGFHPTQKLTPLCTF